MTVYEIADINRNTGKQEADSLRIGRQYYIGILEKDTRAVLPHVDDQTKALVTSPVTDIKRSDNGKEIVFTTKHTTYTLRKVVDDLS
ncbi:hypothetical protein FC679_15195 [Bacillus cereus]|uniref:Uncharacterized protein n=1 Tax=Bacillus cereus VD196 TaxID=1053243 RepID=A0A9W5Q530_BACCE|nr:hypothetical protein [Bacillus cereus]EOO67475.1 hypothetical protein IKE_02602 [Bacillus cereus VD196]MCQ6305053.1 hypothetical protein [Bacillus cereus]MCQ6339525.1 hypothetical protein [Bacillus cereus]MCU4813968.1 hypothetical protein [Bacillus cereus]TKH63350.1 hypothetical protein FC679_15195 [Bacillus cereus]